MTSKSAALAAALALAPLTSLRPQSADATFVPQIAREAAAEGNAAFLRKDYDRARRAYTHVLELVPDNLVGLTNLGVVEFSAGNPAAAEKLLKKAVRIHFENAPAWLTLGIIHMDQGRLDEALADLAQAIAQDPRNPRAHNYLGVVIGRKGWLDGAQSELRKAVEIDPHYSDAHFNLAYFYLECQPPLPELARRHYFRSIELGAPPDREIEETLRKFAASNDATKERTPEQ